MSRLLKHLYGKRVQHSVWLSVSCLVAFAGTFLAPFARAQEFSHEALTAFRWRLIGPFRGGRVTAVAGISGDAKTYYMGTPDGGVWKTINGGVTWFPVFDEAHVGPVGDLAVAASNPNVIYVATGDIALGQTDGGNGVWKSTDAGATWNNIGLRDSRLIPSILVDPHDANLVYAAATGELVPSESRGIYKSSDGGKTWRKVFYKDEQTSPTELDFDPENASTIYAVVRRIPPPPGEKPPEGVETTILRSSDKGETWAPVSDKGLPTEKRGRIGVAVAPALGGKRVFALMKQGLFRSDDAGENWEKITSDTRILGNDYFGRVYSDSKNPDVVYVMQTATYRSTDGGRTFSAWKGTPSGEDDHVLWIAPEDPNRILMGTDQGAVITLDGGEIWNSWFNQPTGQFYRIFTDNQFPYHLYAPQQDSGSVVVPTRSDFGMITYREWYSSGAFESGFIAPDPLNPNFVFSIGWYGVVARLDRTTGQIATLFIPPPSYRVAWETPLLFSPREPHTMYYGSQFVLKSTDAGLTWKEISGDLTRKPGEPAPATGIPKAAAGGHVPSKDDFDGDPFESEESGEEDEAPKGEIQTIAASPLDEHTVWVGTTTGRIHLSKDGTTWSDVTPDALPDRAVINSIEASPHDANTAFAAVFVPAGRRGRFFKPDDHPYFYRTRDAGKSWEKIVTGLPEYGLARVVREDPERPGLLFAGTQTGVYLSLDAGERWKSLQLNMPTTAVTDLAIHSTDLAASTFGRGLFVLDDISPLRLLGREPGHAEVRLFPPSHAVRVRWDNHPDTPLQPGAPAAENPPDGAILYYSLPSAAKGEITLDIKTEQGVLVRHYSSEAAKGEAYLPANVPEFWFYPPEPLETTAGIHRFVWDLRYPEPRTLPYSYFGEPLKYFEYDLPDHAIPGATPRLQPPGPLVTPGTYEVVLTVHGKTYSQRLQVDPDPRVHATAADFAAQRDLSLKICKLMDAAATSSEAVTAVQNEFAARKKSVAADAPKEFQGSVADFQKQLETLQNGTKETLGFGTLNRDASRYLVLVQGADMRPTESAEKAFATACTTYQQNVTAWNRLRTESLPAFNKLLEGQKLAQLVMEQKIAPAPCE